MKFRTDISFLRAVSVLIVLFFHFQIPGFSGGFLGVDVFFVISGFLMTMIVLREFEKDTFSLKGFYIRRIRRLVPALSILLLFVLLISVFFFFESDIRLNAKYVALGDAFVSNIYFWKYQDYFSSTDNILLHTWTLGVEWQFYLIYPLLLMALRKTYSKNKKLFWSILTFVTAISLIIMLLVGKSSTNFIFYMLPARYWELSIGGLAYGLGRYLNPHKTIKTLIVSFSILIIVLSNFFITPSELWPSALTLLPVLATFAILTLNVELSFFDYPIVRFFGNISYSLYLWHWPWYILFKYFGFINWSAILLITILSILSAYLSYKFIESNRKLATAKFAIGSAAIVGILGLLLFLKPEITRNLSIYQSDEFKIGNFKNNYLESGKKDAQFNPIGCFITSGQTINDFNKETCLKCSESKKNILLMGDSHAAQFSASLRGLSEYNILEASVGFTFPLINSRGRKGLVELNDYMYSDFIPKNKDKIDLVLISTHWLMNNSVYLNYTLDEILNMLDETIRFFDENSIDYLIIGQTETYSLGFPKILMLENYGKNPEQYINEKAAIFNNEIGKIVPKRNYIDVYKFSELNYVDANSDIPYMFDTNHFTKYGTDQLVENLIGKRIKFILESSK
ncbi:MAG: acyltransferase family protein [Aequorivita sp.]